jgi:hypothetical protein
MFIAAIIIGVVCAYYLGMQAGIYGGAASLVLLLIGAAIPALSMYAYLLVAVGLIGVCIVGPRLERSPSNTTVMKGARKVLGKLWKKL